MTSTTVAAVDRIPGFRGALVSAGHREYDTLRRVWNGMHDRRPRLIARCTDRDDVVLALAHGRRHGLPIAVRGGGHSIPGFGVVDDGLVIDLALLNAVAVDPGSRRAVVGGGALLGDLDRATQSHGLVVPAGVVSHTGVGGLTLGGGIGRLMRRFGLTIDSLLAAEVVLADGSVVRASAEEQPDLFWALRGGGGNVGIVTSFEFRLHPLSQIVLLSSFSPLEDAVPLLRRAQAAMEDGSSRELLWTSFVRKGHALPWMPDTLVGEPGILSHIEWSGDPAVGVPLLQELLRELAPAAGQVETVPFLELQRADDELFRHGLRSYVKASFTSRLTDELAVAVVERARAAASDLSQIELLAMGGAIRDLPVSASAFAHREAGWLVNVLATWPDGRDDAREIAWARATHAAIAPLASGGAYVNFMGGDEGAGDWTAYGPTLERLRQVKRRYDPENVFRHNQNVLPATG